MAKFYGPIGFCRDGGKRFLVCTKRRSSSVTIAVISLETIVDFKLCEGLNDDINITNEISIIADPYANQNFHSIRYVGLWLLNGKSPAFDVQYPRLTNIGS
jgi:hypothetical protein